MEFFDKALTRVFKGSRPPNGSLESATSASLSSPATFFPILDLLPEILLEICQLLGPGASTLFGVTCKKAYAVHYRIHGKVPLYATVSDPFYNSTDPYPSLQHPLIVYLMDWLPARSRPGKLYDTAMKRFYHHCDEEVNLEIYVVAKACKVWNAKNQTWELRQTWKICRKGRYHNKFRCRARLERYEAQQDVLGRFGAERKDYGMFIRLIKLDDNCWEGIHKGDFYRGKAAEERDFRIKPKI